MDTRCARFLFVGFALGYFMFSCWFSYFFGRDQSLAQTVLLVAETCCQGIRCSNDSTNDVYNVFVVSCADPQRKVDSQKKLEPMWDTVLRGLESRASECDYRVFPMIAHHPDHNFKFPFEPGSGDVIILVGNEELATFRLKCKEVYLPRGTYCIFYSDANGNHTYEDLCEVWEPTRRSEYSEQAVRFVPPGYLPKEDTETAMKHLVQKKVAQLNVTQLQLSHVGDMTPERTTCWEHLKKVSFFQNFQEGLHPFWYTLQWKKIGEESNKVFLNMRKVCNSSGSSNTETLDTILLSQYLSTGSPVISEEFNESDGTAQLYDGIVFFEANLFKDTSQWSPELRRLLTNRTALAEWQLNSHEFFKKKFHPRQVMQNANIWNEKNSNSRYHSTNSNPKTCPNRAN